MRRQRFTSAEDLELMGDMLRGVFDARGPGSFAGLLDALDEIPARPASSPRLNAPELADLGRRGERR